VASGQPGELVELCPRQPVGNLPLWALLAYLGARKAICSFGSQVGSQEHGRRGSPASVLEIKVQLEGRVRTSTGARRPHGMQEVREFDSPRLHQKAQVSGGA